MNRETIDINDFIVLIEETNANEPSVNICRFDEPVIGVAFYGEGNVDLTLKYGNQERQFERTRGLALSFYANEKADFVHHVSADRPLQSIVIATRAKNLDQLPNEEGELFGELLNQLVHPKEDYVEGPSFFMTPEMISIVEQAFASQYSGKAKMMFFRSQMVSLLAHFFGQLSMTSESRIPTEEKKKLHEAREILVSKLENPPSLAELSRQIGLNTFKLKRDFKEIFGVPVFKYLQNERLNKAHDLLRNDNMSIQETAWHVGYDSLSSFSNAFTKKFGYRPSDVKMQSSA